MLKPKTKQNGSIFFVSGKIMGLEVERGRVIKKNTTGLISFGDETVGMNRFYTAQQVGINVDRTISIPLATKLKRDQYIELRSYHTGEVEYYKIVQIQQRVDTAPPSFLLSLTEVLVTLEDERNETERLGAL